MFSDQFHSIEDLYSEATHQISHEAIMFDEAMEKSRRKVYRKNKGFENRVFDRAFDLRAGKLFRSFRQHVEVKIVRFRCAVRKVTAKNLLPVMFRRQVNEMNIWLR